MVGIYMETKYDKGLKGEQYVAKKISELGYKVLYVGGCQLYFITGNKFYNVDLEAFREGKTFWIQVKYKEPRIYYPDTGMEKWRYQNLIKHQKESGLKVLVLFTDNSKKIYGEWLDNLLNCLSNYDGIMNKQTGDSMIYWLLNKLKDYKELLGRIRDAN
ncbi:MAG: hypothetical protein NTZ83_03240 [Candidatus Pacearchaeota archaeon]|nr:hypothetical protein [Candidatus Pacearchaeota archaeon]